MKKEVYFIDEKRTVFFCGSVFHLPDITEKEWGLIKVLSDLVNIKNEKIEKLEQKINDIKTALYD